MSPLGRARIIKAAAAATSLAETSASSPAALSPAQHRRVARDVLEARETSERLLAAARAEATTLLAAARAAAQGVADAAAREAREAEEAKLAAHYLRLKHEEEHRAEGDLDRAITLAVLLAERLLGHALERDPQHVVALARQALSEARGARRVVIDASPLDAEVLRRHLVEVGFSLEVAEIRTDAALPRGSLHLTTSLGNLDATLRPQLERLGRALRDSLHGG